MSENVEKKPAFEKKITLETLLEMKKFLSGVSETTHEARAKKLFEAFPQFKERTLIDYSRLITNICDELFQMAVEGRISLTALTEFTAWDKKTQLYMAGEYVEKSLTPSLLKIIKQQKREHDMSWAEAIGRATGAIPMDKPRREDRKSLDQILTEIADKGARWRALVDLAIEMVGEEEAAAGVHMALFEKVALLRELIGNQYDMVNGRFNRYMGSIKRRLKGELAAQEAATERVAMDPGSDGKIEIEIVPPGQKRDSGS
jgi:hypothetical protein